MFKKLKKMVLPLLVLSLTVLFSCVNSSSEVDEITNEPVSTNSVVSRIGKPDCPEGSHAELYYAVQQFNFHRPIKNCESGFWICAQGGHWGTRCVSNSNGQSLATATLDKGVANLWAQLIDDKLEIHFPIGLKNVEGYSTEDLKTLNADNEYEIYDGITIKPGNYPVKETENELVVLVDLM